MRSRVNAIRLGPGHPAAGLAAFHPAGGDDPLDECGPEPVQIRAHAINAAAVRSAS
jgi:hypothetical protein